MFTVQNFEDSLRHVNLLVRPIKVWAAWGHDRSPYQWFGGFAVELADGRFAYIEDIYFLGSDLPRPMADVKFARTMELLQIPSTIPGGMHMRLAFDVAWEIEPAILNDWIAAEEKRRQDQKARAHSVNVTDRLVGAKAMVETAREQGRQVLIEIIQDHIRKTEGLESIGWRQYTPYFCDGDPCEFWAATDEPDINEIHGSDPYGYTQEEVDLYKQLLPGVKKILGAISDEDILFYLGDHKRITIAADNVTIEIYRDHN